MQTSIANFTKNYNFIGKFYFDYIDICVRYWCQTIIILGIYQVYLKSLLQLCEKMIRVGTELSV